MKTCEQYWESEALIARKKLAELEAENAKAMRVVRAAKAWRDARSSTASSVLMAGGQLRNALAAFEGEG